MNRQAIVEDTLNLWDEIHKAFILKYHQDPTEAQHVILFERAHTFIIHKNIQAEKSGRAQPQQGSTTPGTCTSCGRKLTDKEIKFLADHPDKPKICYHCTMG